MKRPEDIDPALIEKVREATQEKWSALNHDLVREVLAVAWDDIFAHGYTDGFQDQEGLEIQADMLKAGGWAPRIFIWLDGANEEQAERVLDLVGDYAHENEPDGVTLTIGATLAPGKPRFATRNVGTD